MATAPRSFRRAAKKESTRPLITFTLDWVQDLTDEEVEEGIEPETIRSDVFHAKRPTEERLFEIAALIGDEDAVGAEATAVMKLFRDALPEQEFRTLKSRLVDEDDSVDLETLKDVLEWLMEEWSSFPTQPSLASSGSPTSTGTKSTGRVRGQGSTRSPSPSVAS